MEDDFINTVLNNSDDDLDSFDDNEELEDEELEDEEEKDEEDEAEDDDTFADDTENE